MFDYWSRKLWDNPRSLELLISDQNELSQKDKQTLFRNNVETINLELSKHCNRKCNYCPVSQSSRQSDQEIMAEPLFLRITNDLKMIGYAGTLSLNLYNEPLLNPHLEDQVAVLRNALPKAYLSLNSNGDSLNSKRIISLAEAGLNYICVTLHPKPETVISENEAIRRSKHLLRKIGDGRFDDMDVGAIVGSSARLEVRVHGMTVRIQWPDWNSLGGSRGGEIAVLDIGKPTRKTPCVRPFREFTLYYDGTVTPCCEVFHDGGKPTIPIGQVESDGENDIFAVYCNSRLSTFRRSVFGYSKKYGVCKHCPVEDYADGDDADIREAIVSASKAKRTLKVANG